MNNSGSDWPTQTWLDATIPPSATANSSGHRMGARTPPTTQTTTCRTTMPRFVPGMPLTSWATPPQVAVTPTSIIRANLAAIEKVSEMSKKSLRLQIRAFLKPDRSAWLSSKHELPELEWHKPQAGERWKIFSRCPYKLPVRWRTAC